MIMNYLNRVNILGTDVHAERYRDAIAFYPSVEYFEMNSHNYSSFDTIIVAEPYLLTDSILQSIVESNFTGLLILEKMPTISYDVVYNLEHDSYPFIVRYAMLRLFEQPIALPSAKDIRIRWPNLSSTNMQSIDHTLPNVILFLLCQFGIDDIDLGSISCSAGHTTFEVGTSKLSIYVDIFDTNDPSQKLYINELPVEWPNYLSLMWSMFDCIHNDIDNEKLGVTTIYMIMKILEKLRG